MPVEQLIDTGQKLGRTSGQEIRLGDYRRDGYSRDFATDGYLRVNPFEVEDGRADDPDRADIFHHLANWLGYTHNDLKKGSQVSVASSYGAAEVTWTQPAGYSRAPSTLDQRMYAKSTGYTGDSPGTTETSTDPLDTPDNTDDTGDVESHTISLASFAGEWVAIALVAMFDDSVTVHVGDTTDTYTPDAGESFPLTGASDGVLVFVYDTSPTINSISQSPDPNNCSVGSDVTVHVNVAMDGPSQGTLQEAVDGGSWTTIDSSVTAGTEGDIDLTRESGHTYQYRLRYNDVSPNEWDTSVEFFAECDNV